MSIFSETVEIADSIAKRPTATCRICGIPSVRVNGDWAHVETLYRVLRQAQRLGVSVTHGASP